MTDSHNLRFDRSEARLLIPDGCEEGEALARITHLGIGAHQDDLEFMATHGILECLQSGEQWFGGVTCTNGAGSARAGAFAEFTDEEMREVRIREQEEAARLGKYGVMVQLGYPSADLKKGGRGEIVGDLVALLEATRPRFVYTHQPMDKHETHIAVLSRVVEALRQLPQEARPEAVYGCEVWRGLDWVSDRDKIALDVSGNDPLVSKLNGVFASQIAGGKRYDLAVEGRKTANATFLNPHQVDAVEKVWYALDLRPLVDVPDMTLAEFAEGYLERFAREVRGQLEGY